MANKKNNKNKEIMKNALGKQESLKLYNDKGGLVYKFHKDFDGYWRESTFDDKGNELTYKNFDGDWAEYTYDDKGNELTFKNSDGLWYESTYDDKGNELTYRNCHCYWYKKTYDDQGKELTFKDSEGKSRGFEIPEYTMEELTKIVGNEFKIKK